MGGTVGPQRIEVARLSDLLPYLFERSVPNVSPIVADVRTGPHFAAHAHVKPAASRHAAQHLTLEVGAGKDPWAALGAVDLPVEPEDRLSVYLGEALFGRFRHPLPDRKLVNPKLCRVIVEVEDL